MVEPLRIRHPEYSARLRTAAAKCGVTKRDIQKSLKITYEMARRYWEGIARPQDDAKKIALAKLLHLSLTALEYGEPQPSSLQAREDEPHYGLSKAAHEVAMAWDKLPEARQEIYRECIFRDAALSTVLPWLHVRRPTNPSYERFERAVEEDYQRHVKQLRLEF